MPPRRTMTLPLAEPLPTPTAASVEREWALAPGPALIARAVRDGEGPLLAQEWSDIVDERPWAGIPDRYAQHLGTGCLAHVYCTAFAARAGLVLVPAGEVAKIRQHLEAANEPQPPVDLRV